MSEPKHESTDVSPKTIALLERLDSWAHVVVALFFLLMATGVLAASAIVFVRQIPYLMDSYTPDKKPPKKEEAKSSAPAAISTSAQKTNEKGKGKPSKEQPTGESKPSNPAVST